MGGEGEQLWRGTLRGPLTTQIQSKVSQFAGRSTIASGSASVTVSTTAVKSDSIILYGIEADIRASSGVGVSVEITSVSDSNYFAFTYSDSQTLPPRGTTIMWQIMKGS